MAEIVGLLASVIQLVDTVATARDYVKDFYNAPKDQHKLLLEVQSLQPLLKELQNRVETNRSVRVVGSLQQFRKPLIQLEEVMKSLTTKLDSLKAPSLSQSLAWPLWGKKDVQESMNKVERFKALLLVCLTMDIWDVVHEQNNYHDILNSIKDTAHEQKLDAGDILRSVNLTCQNQKEYHDSQEREKIIESLSPLNFFPRQEHILSTRQSGTGEWLLNNEKFVRWKLGQRKVLWCHGIPGAGKTVLSAIVVDHLRSSFQALNIGVACIYLNHKEVDTHTPTNLLASLWRQLVFRKSISKEAAEIYEQHHEPRTRPSLELVRAILASTVAEYSRVYVIVDALDEYPEDLRGVLLNTLSGFESNMKLMLTSRPHIDTKVLQNPLALEIRANTDDINRYVDGQIEKSSRLATHIRNCPDLRQEIETNIVSRSDGMFLAAKLHIDSLTGKHTVKAVRKALINMPSDLTLVYDEVMQRIEAQGEDDRTLAYRTLSWIYNAKRLLLVSELREALAVEAGTHKLDLDNILDMVTVLSVCVGLVIVDQYHIVHLIHHTLQDYLDQIQARKFARAQTEITTTCITYLCFEIFTQNPNLENRDIWELMGTHPFLDYATQYCLVHACGKPEQDIRDSILGFLDQTSGWLDFWNHQYFGSTGIDRPPVKLCIAAFFNLQDIARYLLKENCGFSNALQIASQFGHLEMVQLLIDSGVNVNQQGGYYGNALQAALVHRHDEVLRLLLKHGGDTNIAGEYGTPLQVAAAQGDKTLIHLLLENGADFNAEGDDGTALQSASFQGHEAVVDLLINSGADIDNQGEYGSALQAASYCGHEATVRLLVKNGADVNIQGGKFDTPLKEAAYHGYDMVASVLIRNGAHVNNQAGTDQTYPIQVASAEGHDKIVQLLIENGADVNAQAGELESALQMAALHGHKAIVCLLLNNGARLDGGRYMAAFQAALDNSHEEIIQILLSKGI
ncbi:ankyrin repeat-containing domain protein [Mycena rebaudengoi]|nr:ankyrin repeat-containing domain protein [Mycena rebaudengoi]